ncbi:MAG: Cof-type HAD-IIB family hydrolase [Clostridium sp.]|jgi:Cof subfamily protein (haloacid dehalogenase superfamily)|nr:Cof-type HAD-IIB family hydrolase [Clostridium sp.]
MMKTKHPKILLGDLDGTLIRSDATISGTLRQALIRMTQAGHAFVICSGRTLESIQKLLHRLKLTDIVTMIVANNGSCIYDCISGKQLRSLKVCAHDIALLGEEAGRLGLYMHIYENKTLYSLRDSEEMRYYLSRQPLNYQIIDDFGAVAPTGCEKIMLIDLKDRSRLEAFQKKMVKCLEGSVQILFSEQCYLEVLTQDSGKGSAIPFLLEYLGMEPTDCYAVGDEENDISMIETAHIGIAMRNAKDCVKQVANFVTTKDHNQDGILEIIERFFT